MSEIDLEALEATARDALAVKSKTTVIYSADLLALIARIRIRELEARRDIDSEIIDDLRLRHAQAVTARDAYAEQLLAATKHAVELERRVAEMKGKED